MIPPNIWKWGKLLVPPPRGAWFQPISFDWLVGWIAGWWGLDGWLFGWMDCRLVGWLVGWSAGWTVSMKIRLAQNRPQNVYMPIWKKRWILDCFFSLSLTLQVCEQFLTYFPISQLIMQWSWLKKGSIYLWEQFDMDLCKNLDLAGLNLSLIALKGRVGPFMLTSFLFILL